MKRPNNTVTATFSLAFSGGFCDAVTFVVITGMFSAHVTGNFIEFAKDLVIGADFDHYAKLVVFPVFIVAVMTGGRMLRVLANPLVVLLTEGGLLLLCGSFDLVNNIFGGGMYQTDYWLALGVVFAMGLQNAFGKVFGGSLHGSTTVMTGNVTQFSLELADFLFERSIDKAVVQRLGQSAVSVVGFLAGALFGTLGAKVSGIAAVCFPALIVILLGRINGRIETREK